MSAFEQSEKFTVSDTLEVPIQDSSKPIIEYANLKFHHSENELPIQIFEDHEIKFGTFEIKIRSGIPIISKHIHILFTIDASGSMSEICNDRKSKMVHIKYTLENMLRIFYENEECNMSVHVQAFDEKIKTIISGISNIRDSNLEELISCVSKLEPGSSTDIGLALSSATEHISNYKQENPEHEIVHIFLTDGDITEGIRNYDDLLSLVPNNCSNIFIGYGTDHDAGLLSYLSSAKNNEYRFIDALEKAGLVYGELIHGILYKAIEDVIISISNGEIYNFMTNSWSSEIDIGNLLSEQKKTFHICSKTPDVCSVKISGKTIIKDHQSQIVNLYEEKLDEDLCVYMFRQRTQELLYDARKVSEKYRNDRNMNNNSLEYIIHREDNLFIERKNIKEKLSAFQKILRNYMKENNLESDPIMRMLCDDIYIVYKTTGTDIGTMYTCARQTSNGREQTYMCTTLEQPTHNIFTRECSRGFNMQIPRLQRQTNDPTVYFSSKTEICQYEEEIDDYMPTQDFLSPFTSDSILTLMREVSGNHSIGINRDPNEEESQEIC